METAHPPIEDFANSPQLGNLGKALSQAQAQITTAPFNSTGQVGKRAYRYADLTAIIEAVKDPFVENGLSFSQMPTSRVIDGMYYHGMTMWLMHESGEWIRSTFLYPQEHPDLHRGISGIQNFGKIFTYVKRYALAGAAGVTSDEDNDAQPERDNDFNQDRGYDNYNQDPKGKPPARRQPPPQPARGNQPERDSIEKNNVQNQWWAGLPDDEKQVYTKPGEFVALVAANVPTFPDNLAATDAIATFAPENEDGETIIPIERNKPDGLKRLTIYRRIKFYDQRVRGGMDEEDAYNMAVESVPDVDIVKDLANRAMANS